MPKANPLSPADTIAPVRLAVVSDTHGHEAYTRDAVRMLDSLAPSVVLHCGDIGSETVVRLFRAWPTHFVFGNVDYAMGSLRAAMLADGQTCHERFGTLTVAGVKIAMLHGDDLALLESTIA